MQPQISPGTKIGRYEVRSQLGVGGMGEVYLARDTELDRSVALKVLPASVSADQNRMRRFVQEAKAASSLNHQNIITIYEIGQTDSTRFIATEFVDGITLRQRLKRGNLSLHEVFEIGIQIASGLSAAHDAEIVHRDIKPENIMLRNRDGFVKLLDFGLVKLTETTSSLTDTEAPTRALVNTDAGTVMGTVLYMSPEQARGKAVDARTDIWSLGVILYEMLTGSTPFSGETSADVIASIVKTEPAPITRFAPATPEKLSEIITKALEKDRDDRYQTVKDLLVDLRRLKKRLDVEAEIDRSVSTEAGTRSLHDSQAARTVTQTGSHTRSLDSGRSTSSAEYLVSEIKRHKTGAVVGVLAIVAVIIGGFFLWTKFAQISQPIAAPAMKITKLTSGGRVNTALIDGSTSISPDGKYVVFTLIEAGKVSLLVRQITTGSDVQILPPSEMRNGGTTISHDGEFVYYVGLDQDNPGGTLFQIPILGGTPRKILADLRSPIAFSPDGKQFAFVRELFSTNAQALMVANADGSSERTLSSRSGNDWFSISGPSWSPDGKTIACGVGTDTGGSHMTVTGFSVADGSIKPLTSQKWLGDVRRVLWLKDGSGLVVSAQDSPRQISPTQLWFISYPEGVARRITNDLNGYGAVSLGVSADGQTIVTVQSKPSYQIWTMALEGTASETVQITHGEIDGVNGMDWTADGRIGFITQTGERPELWLTSADGSGARRLSQLEQGDGEPSFSPDGKSIFYTSMRSGTAHIWRINADGSDPKQITSGDFADFSPEVSPDGRWVLFRSLRSGKLCLWKVPIDGGEAIQVTYVTSPFAAYSPDGKFIATTEIVEGPTPTWRIAILPADGGKPIKLIQAPPVVNSPFYDIGWSGDGRSLLLKTTQSGGENILLQPIDGGNAQPVTKFTSGLISAFAVSRDGRRLAISRGESSLDVVLIKNFR
ncbi:MAG TPA: protein kinase [Pyrinomonadaceae bacterium]